MDALTPDSDAKRIARCVGAAAVHVGLPDRRTVGSISKQAGLSHQCPAARTGLSPFASNHAEWVDIDNESDQADRTISTSKLRTLLRFHTWPINVVVFHGSQGSSCFEVGFPLRCLQRLSRPHIATLHCRWRDNRSTGGVFIPVLSY